MWAPQENGLCGFITPMSVGVMVDMFFRWNVVKTHQLWTGVIVILLGNPPLKSSGMSFHFLWNKTCNSILVWVKMSCFSLKFFGWCPFLWFQNLFNSPYHSQWTGDFPSTRPGLSDMGSSVAHGLPSRVNSGRFQLLEAVRGPSRCQYAIRALGTQDPWCCYIWCAMDPINIPPWC